MTSDDEVTRGDQKQTHLSKMRLPDSWTWLIHEPIPAPVAKFALENWL